MSLPFLENHRGPFRFCLTRDRGPKVLPRNRYTSEWLAGETQRADCEEEARALLDDPRDTIVSVHFWSVKEEQFCGGMRR